MNSDFGGLDNQAPEMNQTQLLHVWELVQCTAHLDRVAFRCSCNLWSGCAKEDVTRMLAENHAYPNQEKGKTDVRR
jgi:hypothetical protein